MKIASELTTKQLAYLFCTTVSQIENFVKCKKFNKEDLFSIFEFYARNYNEVRDRELEWLNIEAAYKIHQTNKEDSKWVEERYKDWGLKDKIKDEMWK